MKSVVCFSFDLCFAWWSEDGLTCVWLIPDIERSDLTTLGSTAYLVVGSFWSQGENAGFDDIDFGR